MGASAAAGGFNENPLRGFLKSEWNLLWKNLRYPFELSAEVWSYYGRELILGVAKYLFPEMQIGQKDRKGSKR